MRYDTILFDLDGTLTDSAHGIVNAIQHALRRRGLPPKAREDLQAFLGPPLAESFQNHCGVSAEEAERCVVAYREYFSVKGLFENAVYPGVADVLERLRAAGRRLVLATSKPQAFTDRILAHFDLTRHFAGVYGATMDAARRHKGQVIAHALANTPAAGRAVMVGDRRNDIQGAAANGIDAIGVLYGYGSEDELRLAGATCLIKDIHDLPALV